MTRPTNFAEQSAQCRDGRLRIALGWTARPRRAGLLKRADQTGLLQLFAAQSLGGEIGQRADPLPGRCFGARLGHQMVAQSAVQSGRAKRVSAGWQG